MLADGDDGAKATELPAVLRPAQRAFEAGDWAEARRLAAATDGADQAAGRAMVRRFTPDRFVIGLYVAALALLAVCLVRYGGGG